MNDASEVRRLARRHLAPNFTPADAWSSEDLFVAERGEGCWIFDDAGSRYLDGSSGLFCVNVGYGRSDIASAGAKQMETLAYAPLWSAVHRPGVEAARTVAALAPGDLDVVFFVSSGSEANEAALKFARQYQRARGEPDRLKFLARALAYHGTTLGALSLTGLSGYREPFEPLLVPSVLRVPNTLGADEVGGRSVRELECITGIEDVIEREGPETIAALFAEPVQNSGGALVPPAGYWKELRAICDRYGILLVADEVVTGFGRLGAWFGSELFGVVPDIITFAKGSTSGYAPLGGVVIRRELMETLFESTEKMFMHGATWGAHPVSTAVLSANVAALDAEDAVGNVRRNGELLYSGLCELAERHRIVKTVRGTGFLYAVLLMADRDTHLELTPEQCEKLGKTLLPSAMRDAGLLLRYFDRGGFVLVVSPPLVAGPDVLGELVQRLDGVLSALGERLERDRSVRAP